MGPWTLGFEGWVNEACLTGGMGNKPSDIHTSSWEILEGEGLFCTWVVSKLYQCPKLILTLAGENFLQPRIFLQAETYWVRLQYLMSKKCCGKTTWGLGWCTRIWLRLFRDFLKCSYVLIKGLLLWIKHLIFKHPIVKEQESNGRFRPMHFNMGYYEKNPVLNNRCCLWITDFWVYKMHLNAPRSCPSE